VAARERNNAVERSISNFLDAMLVTSSEVNCKCEIKRDNRHKQLSFETRDRKKRKELDRPLGNIKTKLQQM
jgi:hypothetical protein